MLSFLPVCVSLSRGRQDLLCSNHVQYWFMLTVLVFLLMVKSSQLLFLLQPKWVGHKAFKLVAGVSFFLLRAMFPWK